MIGKQNWFRDRKYGGWGLSPATWQGWVYLAVFIGLVSIIQLLPVSESVKNIITAAITILLIIDVLDIMIHLKKDEREQLHEAIAERNASWAMVSATVSIFVYKAITTSLQGGKDVDLIILVPILAGVIAKAVTNYHLRNK